MQLDDTGKASFNHIYTQADPRAYFHTLRPLDYCIPQLAKPHFLDLIEQYRKVHQNAAPTVLDIGCSYGINAVLLRRDATMSDLYARYGDPHAAGLSRTELLARDRALVASHDRLGGTRFVGLDVSEPALSYAVQAGFLDDAVSADLENHEPTREQTLHLAGADLVISTGCIGYVTQETIRRVVAAGGGTLPWMAHFVLRMFPFDPVEESLAALGYETVKADGVFKQRRFASADEQAEVLDALSAIGVDPQGLEADGWLYAQLYISRPAYLHQDHQNRGRRP